MLGRARTAVPECALRAGFESEVLLVRFGRRGPGVNGLTILGTSSGNAPTIARLAA